MTVGAAAGPLLGSSPDRLASAAAGSESPVLEAQEVTVRVGGHTLLDRVNLQIDHGEFVAVVGPNGAGKSTLAAVLAGDRRPDAGRVLVDGMALGTLSKRPLARRRAVLPQSCWVAFPFRTEQVVMMGRYPRMGRGHQPGPADRAAVADALAAADVTHLVGRPVPTLSGGEQARVSLARVLAQDAAALILDEPSAALDLRHQQEVLALCRRLAAQGRAVLAIVHDLNQAAAADRVAVLANGRLVADGPPVAVLTAPVVAEAFGVAVTVTAHPADGRPVVLPADPLHPGHSLQEENQP
jgi:iron complex transport system ATP-binding protein